MSNFRDAIQQVRADAAQGDLTALEKVLHDADAERAARLVAANLLSQAGEPGAQVLLTAVWMGDSRARVTALRAYLLAQDRLDETLVIEATHSKDRHVRRGVRRLLYRLPYPVSEEFRLRCYLPVPYHNAPDLEENLGSWLLTARWDDFHQIVDALSGRWYGYVPAIPLLLDAMKEGDRAYAIGNALAGFGKAALPALLEALPDSNEPQRTGILHALHRIGGPEAESALRLYAPPPPANAPPATVAPPTMARPPVPDETHTAQTALSAAARIPDPAPKSGLRGALSDLWKRLRGR